MYVYNAVIEVTRKCNMSCAHCLRGNPQKINMKQEYVDRFFEKVDSISTLTLTGGEPSIVPDILEMVRDSAYLHCVDIGNIYIATNGLQMLKDYDEDLLYSEDQYYVDNREVFGPFVDECIKWYNFCSDNEISNISISNDKYHDNSPYSYTLTDIFEYFNDTLDYNFFSFRYGQNQRWEPAIITQGRGIMMGTRDNDVETFEFDTYYNEGISEGVIYLNCKGQIIAGCDWAFDTQKEYKICHVNQFSLDRVKSWNRRHQ